MLPCYQPFILVQICLDIIYFDRVLPFLVVRYSWTPCIKIMSQTVLICIIVYNLPYMAIHTYISNKFSMLVPFFISNFVSSHVINNSYTVETLSWSLEQVASGTRPFSWFKGEVSLERFFCLVNRYVSAHTSYT